MVKPKQTHPPIDNAILELTIEELRRTLDWLSAASDSVKTKALTFMGGGLALLAYLYASDAGDIFYPDETYGRIFYAVGLALIIGALVMLFNSLLPRRWDFSIDSSDLEDMNFEDHNHYLQYVKDNYITAYKRNLATYNTSHRILNLSFFPLVIGGIILVVLKIFNT